MLKLVLCGYCPFFCPSCCTPLTQVAILFLFNFSPPISDFDVFNEGKTQSFFESQQAVMTLCTYLEGIRKTMEELSTNQLSEYFNKLLQVSTFYTSTIQTSQVSVLIIIILE